MAGEPGGMMDVEFLHQMLAVFFDGLDADAEFSRDLFVGRALRHKLQHLRFARAQVRREFSLSGTAFAGLSHRRFQMVRERRTEIRMSIGDIFEVEDPFCLEINL